MPALDVDPPPPLASPPPAPPDLLSGVMDACSFSFFTHSLPVLGLPRGLEGLGLGDVVEVFGCRPLDQEDWLADDGSLTAGLSSSVGES